MCKQTICPYNHQCADCAHNATQHKRTGLDTSDMRAYKREYMRRHRARQLQREMECAGVAR